MEAVIEILGAREHNLKDIDVQIPRNKLVVITGVSGSGKSSLAFDTVYAEGQRRYLESFSAYARQFLGELRAPDVDKVSGLSPVIAIEQKTTGRNPRSTVGTVTEVYDLFRLLYARAADAFSLHTGQPMVRLSDEQVVEAIARQFAGQRVSLCAPLVRARKGHYRELFEGLMRQGFTRVRVDGQMCDLVPGMEVGRYKIHDIEVVIDRLEVPAPGAPGHRRLYESVLRAMKQGDRSLMLLNAETGTEAGRPHWYSQNLMDPATGLSYDLPSPNTFSFNSPYGACPHCGGLGQLYEVDPDTLVPDPSLSINAGAIAPLGEARDIWMFGQLQKIANQLHFKLTDPWHAIPPDAQHFILTGQRKGLAAGIRLQLGDHGAGIEGFILQQYHQSQSEKIKDWAAEFMRVHTCPACRGARLKPESLAFRMGGLNIAEVADLEIGRLHAWLHHALEPQLSDRQRLIGAEVLKEIRKRVGFLADVGLDYLSLNRPAKTLSGGESQRIRLATQIGSQLVNVLYILDEPSIGLHQRDNERLIHSLLRLRDLGNSVLVVEHDKDTMLASDYILEFGPGAGVHGGRVVAQGSPEAFMQQPCPTADYLAGRKAIAIPHRRRTPNPDRRLILRGATGHNLQGLTIELPLGLFLCVTGVSGSGKSSLINETLLPILSQHLYRSKQKPLPYASIEGIEHLNKVIRIDQAAIGRTPRSNPATYTGVFTDIRALYAELTESKIRGYKVGRFSFNVKGGRCETCEGGGVRTIEMNFLPDVYVECETCQGRRYNRETLEVRYKGKSIADVLNMTVDNAVAFFEAQPRILRPIRALQDVGLGYITLGQSALTLSGGEAQRVKVAAELAKRDTGDTLYILDEPTTGLHFKDIDLLLHVLQALVNRGNTVLVIEHNLDVIKVADWLIDIGPEGGRGGGQVVATGTPEALAAVPASHTGRFLARELAAP